MGLERAQRCNESGFSTTVNVTINAVDVESFRPSNRQALARVAEALRLNRNRHEVFGDGPGQRFARPPKHVNCKSTLPIPTGPNVLGPPKREIKL